MMFLCLKSIVDPFPFGLDHSEVSDDILEELKERSLTRLYSSAAYGPNQCEHETALDVLGTIGEDLYTKTWVKSVTGSSTIVRGR